MKLVKSVLSASILAAAAQSAVAVETDVYASIRAEYLGGDGSDWGFGTGMHDAYSRVGLKVSEELDGLTISYNFEFSVDPTGDMHDAGYTEKFNARMIRQNTLTLSGDFGSIAAGELWSPFYNAITWGTGADRFDGYYTGYQTVSSSRIENAIAYNSPTVNGMQVAILLGADSATDVHGSNSYDNHKDVAITYSVNDEISVAAALTDGDSDAQKDKGFGISYTKESLFLSANIESSDATNSGAKNIFASYSLNDSTSLSGHVGATDGDYDNARTLAITHRYNDQIKVWAQYYTDDTIGNVPSVGLRVDLD